MRTLWQSGSEWRRNRPKTGQRAECHGFVLWRIRGGTIAERSATVTPLHELAASNLQL